MNVYTFFFQHNLINYLHCIITTSPATYRTLFYHVISGNTIFAAKVDNLKWFEIIDYQGVIIYCCFVTTAIESVYIK